MYKHVVLVFSIFLFSNIDARKFRCDYTFFKEIGGYLKYQEIPANWHEARLRCHLEGANLASPLTEAIGSQMSLLSNRTCPNGFWTGVHSLFSRGDFVTVEGIPLSTIPHKWFKCEPNNHKDDERCIVQLPNTNLADVSCNETLPYFCYKKADSGMKMNNCGTIDNEYTFNQKTSKCYKFHSFPRSWSKAYMTCMAEGGHLAVINSDKEAEVLKDIFSKYPAKVLVGDFTKDVTNIGFHDWNERREYRTIHGQTLKEAGYAKWAPNEPNNPTSQFCGAMYRSGLLDNNNCFAITTFICEKDPKSLTGCADED